MALWNFGPLLSDEDTTQQVSTLLKSLDGLLIIIDQLPERLRMAEMSTRPGQYVPKGRHGRRRPRIGMWHGWAYIRRKMALEKGKNERQN